ncbi:MAG: endopeptidase La [Elusimicrobia bacterium]|nr:endopeptidase La [Elusimicrobiota bacterium]
MENKKKKNNMYPLLPVRDIVILPYMLVPLAVGRRRSINALRKAVSSKNELVIVAQKDIYEENPGKSGLYSTGVLAGIVQVLDLPDGSLRVLVEGEKRVRIGRFFDRDEYVEVAVEDINETSGGVPELRLKAMMRNITDLFEEYAKFNTNVDSASHAILDEVTDPGKLADIITGHIKLKKDQAQELLEESAPLERLGKLSVILKKEIEILNIKNEIDGKVRKQIGKSQKEQYLSEQMKAIKQELLGKEAKDTEILEFQDKINKANMSEEAREQALKELGRMEKMIPFSPEATVVRTYLDWLIKLPWSRKTPNNIDLKKAEKILEKEHYGLCEAKERILEYLAVSKLSRKLKTPILCFVGPPGTGKTSFGRSIAHALGRKFTRVSLGGIRDEAEIRGHRRTYIGSMPGRIIQSITKAESRNPVFLMDEIDKMGKDFRGDPASALLEALDPEQNRNFNDHYMEVDFDLTDVMFITTANTVSSIPPAMLDRMEIIEFPGYTRDEKINIAEKFLIPKQMNENGLKSGNFSMGKKQVGFIIDNYTREAGVRNLEREIAKALRKVAKKIASGGTRKIILTNANLAKNLGIPKYSYFRARKNSVGIAAGLSWTQNGGESLSIEVSIMPGEGKLNLTGTLGDVMKESAQTALSYIRANAGEFGLKNDFYKDKDIHVHVPSGAVPKEGPSAGITICTALLSVLLSKPVRRNVVMTGEITLSGNVLEIGGFKEKILAAHRDGFKTVIFPSDNRKNMDEIPDNIKKNLDLIPVRNFKEVVEYVF